MSVTKDSSTHSVQAETREGLSSAEKKAGFYLGKDGEWIPDGWESQPLSVLGHFSRGKSKHRPRYDPVLYGGKYPFIQTGDVKSASRYIKSYSQTYNEVGLHQSKLWNRGTLCITIAANIAETGILKFDGCFPDSVIGFFAHRKLDTLFTFYLFDYYRRLLKSKAIGSVQDNLSVGSLEQVKFNIPPSDERDEITKILGSLDDKIELLREQNETLEALAQTLFKRWFIDFNFPDENGNPYKDTGCNIDELRETTLEKFIDFNPIEKIDRNKEYLFFDMKCLPLNQLSLSEGIYKKASSATAFREGDTLFAKITPCLENGKTGLVLDLKGEEVARGSTEFIVMRAKTEGSICFNYCLARNSKFRDYAIRSMSGSSGRQRVPLDRVKSYSIIDSSKIIQQFEAIVSPSFEKVKSNTQQIQMLTNLRDTLLPKLMKGEIRVSL